MRQALLPCLECENPNSPSFEGRATSQGALDRFREGELLEVAVAQQTLSLRTVDVGVAYMWWLPKIRAAPPAAIAQKANLVDSRSMGEHAASCLFGLAWLMCPCSCDALHCGELVGRLLEEAGVVIDFTSCQESQEDDALQETTSQERRLVCCSHSHQSYTHTHAYTDTRMPARTR